jgi:hypothetical protein
MIINRGQKIERIGLLLFIFSPGSPIENNGQRALLYILLFVQPQWMDLYLQMHLYNQFSPSLSTRSVQMNQTTAVNNKFESRLVVCDNQTTPFSCCCSAGAALHTGVCTVSLFVYDVVYTWNGGEHSGLITEITFDL